MKYNGKNAKTYHKLRQQYIVMLPNLPFAFSSAKTNADIFKLTCFGVQTECHSKACELPYEGKTESGCWFQDYAHAYIIHLGHYL